MRITELGKLQSGVLAPLTGGHSKREIRGACGVLARGREAAL